MKNTTEAVNRIFTLKNKLIVIILVAVVPFLLITLNLILAFQGYSNSYDTIINNMTTANAYNMNFKENMDESIYRMVARDLTVARLIEDGDVRNPYEMIADIRRDSKKLMQITNEPESQGWLLRLSRNVDTLEDRLDDICANLSEGDKYDENIEILDNVYILTDMIQEDIQYYIYYQTKSIERLKNSLNEEISHFMVSISIVLILVLAAVVLVTLLVTFGIIRPVDNLVHLTEEISKGDFSVRASVETGDEIEILADSVNEMTEHLQDMVTTIKEDERRMRHAELRLLQEQINPHFLYNTLDTIVWLIESNQAEKAEEMVISLSSFFRLVLSHGREYITIEEEEKHIRSYLEIQQVRYKDILRYDISLDPNIHPFEILKLTLQPLVENALYHGIKYKRAMGEIRVRGYLEGEKIVITVSDDGVGMDEETLDNLRQEIQKPCKDTAKGFGLANVNERIRMNFGPEYGISIFSEKGAGTTVRVEIPAILEEKKSTEEEQT